MGGFVVMNLSVPLILKDQFSLGPLVSGLTSLGDALGVLLGNYVYLYLSVQLQWTPCFLGMISSAVLALTFILPMFYQSSVVVFLLVKYLFFFVWPLMFSGLPIVIAQIGIPERNGEFMGYFTFAQGIGRLVGTGVTGLLYNVSPSLGFKTSGVNFVVCFLLFFWTSLKIPSPFDCQVIKGAVLLNSREGHKDANEDEFITSFYEDEGFYEEQLKVFMKELNRKNFLSGSL